MRVPHGLSGTQGPALGSCGQLFFLAVRWILNVSPRNTAILSAVSRQTWSHTAVSGGRWCLTEAVLPPGEGITRLTKPWVVGVRSDPCRPRRIHAVTRIKQTSARDWSRCTGGQVSEAMCLDPRTTLSHRYDHAAVSKRCARDDDR